MLEVNQEGQDAEEEIAIVISDDSMLTGTQSIVTKNENTENESSKVDNDTLKQSFNKNDDVKSFKTLKTFELSEDHKVSYELTISFKFLHRVNIKPDSVPTKHSKLISMRMKKRKRSKRYQLVVNPHDLNMAGIKVLKRKKKVKKKQKHLEKRALMIITVIPIEIRAWIS